jgi:hypothetical protein
MATGRRRSVTTDRRIVRDKIRQEAERVAIRSMQVKSASRKSDTLPGARAAGRRYPLFYLKVI